MRKISRRLARLALTLIVLLAACSVLFLLQTHVAWANTTLCSGANYNTCTNAGYTDHGYGANNGNSYWRMDTGHNCTNYVAYVEQTVNSAPTPSYLLGNADTWYSIASAHHVTTDHIPAKGATAWWGDAKWNGNLGHVAYVESVNRDGSITISEDASPNGPFDWMVISPGSSRWPGGFIHFKDLTTSSPSTPVAVSRSSTDMTVFYNDGNGDLTMWSWTVSSGWWSNSWHDTFGTNGTDAITGQPCAVVRDSSDMDVFYRTQAGRLIHRGWNTANGWEGPDVLVKSDDVGDPACVSRDSGDLQAFYRTSEGEIKSVSWNWQTSWNLNPQRLYTSGATSDPGACSRSSDSMEVFFGKNNGNLVHLGWTSEYGWITQDWPAGAGVTGKPSCISRNGGADMSADYQESNGKVGEEFWNWQTGWNWQDWNAQLIGSPRAIPGPSNVIDVFYRETGGNLVDRYFTGYSWATLWVVGPGSATSDPFPLVRGGGIELFYWNHSTLMDANWSPSTNSWNATPVH